MDARRIRRGPILARRVPIPNRCPDIKLPEPPASTMPPTVLKHAACAGEDPDLFFPDGSQASQNTAHAKAVCARCPVRDACLKWAIDNQQTHGIWGGLDERERADREANALALVKTNPEDNSDRRTSGRAPQDAREAKEGRQP